MDRLTVFRVTVACWWQLVAAIFSEKEASSSVKSAGTRVRGARRALEGRVETGRPGWGTRLCGQQAGRD